MKIIFGTTNSSKVEKIKRILWPIGHEVVGIKKGLPGIEEDGKTVLENAQKKAVHYSSLVKGNILTMDTSLYLDQLPPGEQPGIFVRKLNSKKRLTDEEMIREYSKLFKKYGGRITGYWETAWVLAKQGKIIQSIVAKTPKRYYLDKPSKIVTKGMPINSLQVDPISGKYFSEMTAEEQDIIWQKAAGAALAELFEK